MLGSFASYHPQAAPIRKPALSPDERKAEAIAALRLARDLLHVGEIRVQLSDDDRLRRQFFKLHEAVEFVLNEFPSPAPIPGPSVESAEPTDE